MSGGSFERTQIVNDPIPSQLGKLNTAIQRKKIAQSDVDAYTSLAISSPFVHLADIDTSPKIDELTKQLNIAKDEEAKSLKESSKFFNSLGSLAFGGGSKIGDFSITTESGNKELDDKKIIAAAAKINKDFGGGTYSQTLIENELRKAGMNYLVQPDVEKAAEPLINEAEKAGKIQPITDEGIKKEIQRIATIGLTKLKADAEVVIKDRDTRIANLQSQYTKSFKDLNEKYIPVIQALKDNYVSEAQSRMETSLFQYKAMLDDHVKQGMVSKQDAQAEIDTVIKESQGMFQEVQDKSDAAAREQFEQEHGEEFKTEVNQLYSDFLAQRNKEVKSAQSKYERIKKETDLRYKHDISDYQERLKETDQENRNALEGIYGQAAQKVFNDRYNKDVAYRGALSAMANIPGVATGIYGKLFGSAFLQSIGDYTKNIGNYFNSIGVGGKFVDWMKGSGELLSKEKFIYKPELSFSNFFDPVFLSQSLGNTSGYMLPTALAAIVTRNPYIAGTIGTLGNSAMMAGDTYRQAIEGGDSPSDASVKARDMFAQDTMISLPLEILGAKLFVPALGGMKASAMEIAGGITGETLQEGLENPLQATIIDPRKSFGKELIKGSNISQALEAGLGAGVFGAFSNASGKEGVKGMDAQYWANIIDKKGFDRAKAIVEYFHNEGSISEDFYTKTISQLSDVQSKLKDAKELGLTQHQALAFIGLSDEADKLKASAANITNPTLKSAAETKVKEAEKKVEAIVNGEPVAAVQMGDLATIAAPSNVVEKMMNESGVQELVADGSLPIVSDDPKIQKKVEELQTKHAEAQQSSKSVEPSIENTKGTEAKKKFVAKDGTVSFETTHNADGSIVLSVMDLKRGGETISGSEVILNKAEAREMKLIEAEKELGNIDGEEYSRRKRDLAKRVFQRSLEESSKSAEPSIEDKKADIERRRQDEFIAEAKKVSKSANNLISTADMRGLTPLEAAKEILSNLQAPVGDKNLFEYLQEKVNKKYDAELSALEKESSTTKTTENGKEEKTEVLNKEAVLPEQPSSVRPKKEPGVMEKARGIEDLTDPRDIVLQHFANGGKIHPSAITDLFGGKDERIRQNVSTEGERRSRIGLLKKSAAGIKELAHQLWESDPSGKYTDRDYIDAIESVIREHNSPSSMAKELVERYVNKAVAQELTAEEAQHIDNEMINKLHKEVESLPEEHTEAIVELLKKYQDNYGFVDWEKLKQDSDGFNADMLSLPEETQNALYGLIEKNISPAKSERGDVGGKNDSRTETVEQQNVKAQLQQAEAELHAARTAFDSKRKELDKGLVEDQEDLFGDRKSTKADQLFDERVSVDARDKAMQPFKDRVENATQEYHRLQNKLSDLEGKPSSHLEIKFNEEEANKETPSQEELEKVHHEKRAAFLEQFSDKNPNNDFKVFQKLPKAKKKAKLDAMSRKLIQAKREGTISEEDYNNLSARVNNNYESIRSESRVMAQEANIINQEKAIQEVLEETTGLDVEEKVTNKEKAKVAADKLRKVANLIEGDKTTLKSDLLALPKAVIVSIVRTAANVIEAGGSILDAIEKAVDYVKKNTEHKNNKEIKASVEGLFKKVGLIAEKTSKKSAKKDIKENIVQSDFEKSGKMTFRELFRRREKAEKRGEQNMKQRIDNLQTDAIAYFKANEVDLSAKQVTKLLNDINDLKDAKDPQKKIDKLIDRIDYLKKNKDNLDAIDEGHSIREKIRKAINSKTKEHAANNKSLIRQFLRINPDNVTDPKEYVALAGKILSNAQGIRVKLKEGAGVTSNEAYEVSNKEIEDFIGKESAAQEKAAKEKIEENYNDLVALGIIDPKNMSLDEMNEIIDAINSDDVDASEQFFLNEAKKAEKVAAMKKAVDFNILGLKEWTANQEYLNLTPEQKEVTDNLTSIDTSKLNLKQLAKLNDVINNIVVNNDFSGSGNISAVSTLQKNVAEAINQEKKAGIKLGSIKNVFIQGFSSTNLMIEFIAKSSKLAAELQRLTGISGIFNGHAKAKAKFQDPAVMEYTEMKWGLKDIDSPENRFKRGIYARIIQHFGGDTAEQVQEFNRVKGLIKQTADTLLKSDDVKEQKEGRVIAKLYDEMLEGASSASEVKIDDINKKLVEFWKNKFDERKEKTAESAEIFNNLEWEDIENYTATKMKGVGGQSMYDAKEQKDIFEQVYISKKLNSKQAGTKMKRARMNVLSKGMALDLDFDSVQSEKYYETNYDVETAKSIALARAFFESDEAAEILGNNKNKKIVQDSVRRSVLKQKGLTTPLDVFERAVVKGANVVQAKGVRIALGSLSQLPKQYVSVAANTILNLAGDMALYFKAFRVSNNIQLFKDFNIGLRGETKAGYNKETDLNSIDRTDFNQNFKKGVSWLNDVTKKVAEGVMSTLVRSDVSIARTSWLAFYMQDLKNRGIDIEDRDWNMEHEHPDYEAAAYAEQMTSRNQNPNDPSAMPNFYKDNVGYGKIIKNIFLPFSTFQVNQRVRMTNDAQKILYGGEKKEAFKSLAATAGEQVVFNAIKVYVLGQLTTLGAHAIARLYGMWDDDDEAKYKAAQKIAVTSGSVKFNMSLNFKKTAANSMSDFLFSGLGSSTQKLIQRGMSSLYGLAATEESGGRIDTDPKLFYNYDPTKYGGTDLSSTIGLYGVLYDNLASLKDWAKMSATGQIEKVTKQGTDKSYESVIANLTPEEKKIITASFIVDALALVGVSDADLSTMNNKLQSIIRRKLQVRYGGKETMELYRKPKGDNIFKPSLNNFQKTFKGNSFK